MPSADTRLRLRWTLLSALGLSLGIVAALVLGAPIEAVVGMMLVTPVLTAIVGTVLGTSQWVLLRRRIANARWWIPASAAGLGIGLAAGVVLVEQVGRALTGGQVSIGSLDSATRALSMAVVGVVSGVCLGAAQKLVLRSGPGIGRGWLGMTALGLGAALVAGSLAADLIFGGLTGPGGFIAFVLVAGLVAGAITSKPLVRLSAAAA
jgi:hypothetical protein